MANAGNNQGTRLSIVTLGRIARTGASGKLIGICAEKLPGRVAVDILTVN